MTFNRRDFIRSSALAAGAAVAGCATRQAGIGPAPKDGDIRSVLVHLGHNMWCDWYPADVDLSKVEKKSLPDTKLRCRDDFWRRAVDHAAAKGMNQIVIDVGEGLVFPRRPELGIEGSWSAEKLAAEVDRLHGLGLEVIPKLNFSTTHSGWTKHYRRIVGSPEYYRMCEDVLRDVYEVFGKPRYIHLGMDEEDGQWHVMEAKTRAYVLVRRGEIWKHDFLHLVRTVENLGARAWAWSDYGWLDKSFTSWCPKSVLLSNWYYDESCHGFELKDHKGKILPQYVELDEKGFDQVPCGTNWVGWKRVQKKIGADDVIGKLVNFSRAHISKTHLKGFLMAPWAAFDTEEHTAFVERGIDLFAEALKV